MTTRDDIANNPELRRLKELSDKGKANVLFLDLGEGQVETTTEGWTDSQIRNKSVADFDLMIRQAQLALDQLTKTITEQEALRRKYERLKRRREELGG